MPPVIVNMSGTTFHFERAILSNRPYDRLSQMILYATKSGQPLEFSIDRSDVCFEAILNFYKTGELHIPVSVCMSLFRQEMEYWGISQEALSSCCQVRNGEYLGKENRLALLGLHLPNSDQQLTSKVTGSQSFGVRLWNIVDYRERSCLAKTYLCVIMVLVVASIFISAYSTDPHLRRPATKCELLEHLQETGSENIDHIRTVIGNPDCTSPDRDETPFNKADYDWTQSGISTQQSRKKRSFSLPEHGNDKLDSPGTVHISVEDNSGAKKRHSASMLGRDDNQSKIIHHIQQMNREHSKNNQLKYTELEVKLPNSSAEPPSEKPKHRQKRSFAFDRDGNNDNTTDENSYPFTTFGPNANLSDYTQIIVNTSGDQSVTTTMTSVDGDGSTTSATTEAPEESNDTDDTCNTGNEVNVAAARTQEIDVPELTVIRSVFIVFSVLLLVLFIIDKSLRLFSCPSIKLYFTSLINIFDTCALFAHLVYIILVNVKDSEHTATKVFLCIQMLRIVRILVIIRHTLVYRVLQAAAWILVRDMYVVTLIIAVTMTMFGSMLYLIEDAYSMESIPLAWYYVLVTLTTVGYGDVLMATGWGRLVVCACAIYGMCVLAVVVSVFVSTIASLHKLAFVQTFTDENQQQRWQRPHSLRQGSSKVGARPPYVRDNRAPEDDDEEMVDYSRSWCLPVCCGKGRNIERDVLVPRPKSSPVKYHIKSSRTSQRMPRGDVQRDSDLGISPRWPPRPISGLSVRPSPSFLARDNDGVEDYMYTSQSETGLKHFQRIPRQGSYDFSANDPDTNKRRPPKGLASKSAYTEISDILGKISDIDDDGDTDVTAFPMSEGLSRERSKSVFSYIGGQSEDASVHGENGFEMEERQIFSRNDGSGSEITRKARL